MKRTSPGPEDPKEEPLPARLFRFIQDNPGCPRHAIETRFMGASQRRKREALDELLETGAVKNRGNERRHCYHAEENWLIRGGRVENPADYFSPNRSDLIPKLEQETSETEGSYASV